MATKTISCVSFTAAMVMVLFLATSIGRAKGEIDCNSFGDSLDGRVHEACKDLGSTSMCGGYCSIKSANACSGKCNDGKCKCFKNCGAIFTGFLERRRVRRFSVKYVALCHGPSAAECDKFCQVQSANNCRGRCVSKGSKGCKCFEPQ